MRKKKHYVVKKHPKYGWGIMVNVNNPMGGILTNHQHVGDWVDMSPFAANSTNYRFAWKENTAEFNDNIHDCFLPTRKEAQEKYNQFLNEGSIRNG